jgi:hypothetical protein
MISFFQNGIQDINPSKELDLPQLVRLIRNNPEKDLIERIRTLRNDGDEKYKILKKRLPNVTPNCSVRERSLDKNHGDLEKNLISFANFGQTDHLLPI